MDKQMSDNGKKLLAQWEGFELTEYNDVAGLATIGVGHLLTLSERASKSIVIDGVSVDYSNGITEDQVYALLGQDLDRFEDAVNQRVTVDLEQNQYDALVSFSFNVGVGAFRDSTLLRLLNEGQYGEVPAQLLRWVKAGGKTVQGLVNRRENEIKLWNGEI